MRAKAEPTIPVSSYATFGEYVWLESDALKADDPAADADRHRVRAIVRAELLHQMLDVHLHGLFRDEQPIADGPIAVTSGNLLEDFDLSGRERLVREMFRDLRGDGRR